MFLGVVGSNPGLQQMTLFLSSPLILTFVIDQSLSVPDLSFFFIFGFFAVPTPFSEGPPGARTLDTNHCTDCLRVGGIEPKKSVIHTVPHDLVPHAGTRPSC